MSPELMRALTDVLVAVVTVTIPIIGTFTVNWLRTHTSQKQLESMQTIGSMAVKAVEQMFEGLSGNEHAEANAKLTAATQRVHDLTARFGIKLNDDQVRTIIEQAVLEMKHDVTALVPATPNGAAPPALVPTH